MASRSALRSLVRVALAGVAAVAVGVACSSSDNSNGGKPGGSGGSAGSQFDGSLGGSGDLIGAGGSQLGGGATMGTSGGGGGREAGAGEPLDAGPDAHGDSGASKDGGQDSGKDGGPLCGNGHVDPGEDCDPPTKDTACTIFCHWHCVPGADGDAYCSNDNPCDGTETCSSGHLCVQSAPPTAGTSCGGGNVCKGGQCVPSTCGDGVVVSPEECDDGNLVDGDGCNSNCKLSCVSTDTTRNCSAPCLTRTCNDTTHTCSTPVKKTDNTLCGSATQYCSNGICKTAVCNNGVKEPGETCDDGDADNTNGCTTGCDFSCVTPTTDCGTAPACQKFSCNGSHVCVAGPDTSLDNSSCGPGQACKNGSCNLLCGNGVLDPGEQCDDHNTKDGDGCQHDCTFTCANPATDCPAPAACQTASCNGSHLCATANQAQYTSCGSGLVCDNSGNCVSACGNNHLDPGEQCDDGNTTDGDGCQHNCVLTCANPVTDCTASAAPKCNKWACDGSHKCNVVVDSSQNNQSCGGGVQVCKDGACGALCGNGQPDPGEECDDGNKVSGDGCENNCLFSCHAATASTDCSGAPATCNKWACDGSNKCIQAVDSSLNGQGCGSLQVCSSGSCIASCGDGTTEASAGEQCDFGTGGTGNGTGGGCDGTCQFQCQSAANCDDALICDGTEVCNTVSGPTGNSGMKCGPGTPAANGTACGTGSICKGGSCQTSACGDGIVDAGRGEECDFGAGNNIAGQGCEPSTCTFTCHADADCNDNNVCDGTETCGAFTATNGSPGKKCNAGSSAAKCVGCGGTNLCNGSGACNASTCGDGCVGAGETCEPPNTATCDGSCATQCDMSGYWASYLSIPVTWPAHNNAQKGSGTIQVWSLVTTADAAGTSNQVLPCMIEVPSFSTILGTIPITFPQSLFNNGYLPSAAMPVTTGRKPGASYTSQAFTNLLGLKDPVPATWPGDNSTAGLTIYDPENDGHPGVRVATNAPTGIFLAPTATQMDLVIRQTTALTGTITDCTHVSGTANVSHEDNHVVDCTSNSSTCDFGFLDANRPIYVTATASFQSREALRPRLRARVHDRPEHDVPLSG